MTNNKLTHIYFYGKDGWFYGWLLMEENNFSLKISKIHKGNVSICDLGSVHGLNDLSQVTLEQFSDPHPQNLSFECAEGHGCVVKMDIDRLKKPMYLRLYNGDQVEYQIA
jgi:hypothetical protein